MANISVSELAKKPNFKQQEFKTPAPAKLRGYIGTQFSVHCACTEWVWIEASNKEQAAAEAAKVGWKFTKARGWICPECQPKAK